MAGHNDLGYKYLFAHPELVRALLVDFTDYGSLGGLDARAWERVNPAYVSELFSERCDDIVWRVGAREQSLYVYLLLEFQSGVERSMALRMQVYIGLLYQDLVERKELRLDRSAKAGPCRPGRQGQRVGDAVSAGTFRGAGSSRRHSATTWRMAAS